MRRVDDRLEQQGVARDEADTGADEHGVVRAVSAPASPESMRQLSTSYPAARSPATLSLFALANFALVNPVNWAKSIDS